MKSVTGMLAAEATLRVLNEYSSMEIYWDNLKNSWIWEELYRARNYRPAFEYGLIPGLGISTLEHYLLKGKAPFTLKHGRPDHEAKSVAKLHRPIHYPKLDGVLSFDVPTSTQKEIAQLTCECEQHIGTQSGGMHQVSQVNGMKIWTFEVLDLSILMILVKNYFWVVSHI